MQAPRPTVELLSAQVASLRALARSLVRDAHLADDAVQDTLVLALERPPRDPERLRPWLARVLRRRLRAAWRSGAARGARERAHGAPDEPLAADELVLHLHTQRALAEELLALDEPYRAAILLRFYEDLPPREIARRLGLGVPAVKSRLQRGLARLRERLDRRNGGDRQAWMAALAPFARGPWGLAAAPAAKAGSLASQTALGAGIGGILVNGKLLVLSLVLVAGAWLALRSPERSAPSSVDPEGLATAEEPLAALDALPTPRAGRTAEDPPAPERAAPALAAAGPARAARSLHAVRGRVVDAGARPVDGLVLRAEAGETLDTSGGGGRFAFETTDERGVVEVADAAWSTIRRGAWSAGSPLDPVVVCAPAATVAGRVVDESGRALAGARLLLVLPEGLRAGLEDVLDASLAVAWSGWSDAQGRFALERAPRVAGLALFAAKDGYVPRLVRDAETPLDALEVVLERPRPDAEAALEGRVQLSDGTPASAARVALGIASVPADEQGFFVLPLAASSTGAPRLVAAQQGFLPAALERPGEPGDALGGWPGFVELVLGEACASIRGRVVDHEGRPCAEAYVWVEDPTPFGTVGTHPLSLEGWLAGGRVPGRATDSLAEIPEDGGEDGGEVFGSATPIEPPSAMLWYARTDPDGRFELPGLLRRPYDVRAVDAGLGWTVVERAVPAGTDALELRVPAPDGHERLVVRVATRHGDPVPGVGVQQWAAAFDQDVRVRGGRSHVTRFLLGRSGASDERGRVVFENVPREGIQLFVSGDDVLPAYASVDAAVASELVVTVAARAFLRVTVEPPVAADAIEVTGDDGERQPILLMRADGYSDFQRFPLDAGRSGTVTVTSEASSLHLLVGDERVATLPLVLRPGEVHEVLWRP